MTTAQPLQIPFTEFHETGNFIHSQTTKLPKFQENTQNIWNFQKNDVPLRVNKQNSQKPSHMPTLTWIGKEKVVNHHLDTICVLNGKTFTIPYIKSIYKQSLLKNKRTDEKGNYILRFVDLAKEHTIHLTDLPTKISTKEGDVDL